MSFDFTTEQKKTAVIIKPSGSLMERYEANELLDEIDDLLIEGNRYFVIDLKKLEYLNSSGLTVLLNILTKARNAGGEAIVCNVSTRLNKLLIMTRLDSVFTLAATQKEALQLLDGHATSPEKNA